MAARTLDGVDAKKIRDLLLDRRRVLEFDLAGLENETGGSVAERAGVPSAAPGHPADLASDAAEQDVVYGRLKSQSEELSEVLAALERLENGTYGDCEACGKAIPLERLQAIPYARLCLPCKSEEERGWW